MKFEFATANRIVFGAGALREISAIAEARNRRTLVVTGRDVARAGKLFTLLREAGTEHVTFSVGGEPELSTVERGAQFGRAETCERVIGFGGGSVLDTAKAIAAMMTNDGELLDYLEIIGHGKPLTRQPVSFIAIPTTAGTGSEVTRNAVLASPEHKVKVSLRSPLMLARVAIVDPELTYDLPPALTASTGLDALTQLIEPFVCSRANPMTDGWCVDGIARVARSLRTVVLHNGQDKAAREDMALASLFGGLCLANAGLGAVHGFAGPIGGMFSAPHGAICAVLLPHVMAANIRALRQRDGQNAALSRYDRVAQLLTSNPLVAADAGVEWVRALVSDLKIPTLRFYGIQVEHITDIVEKAKNASSMKANPILLNDEALAGILRAAL